MHDATVTLFNRYEGQTGIYWYPSALKNVTLTIDKAAILAKYGGESNDSAAMSVPYQNMNGGRLVSGKPWVSPNAWENQVNELLSETLTFASGDFFWWGEWPDSELISDEDYGIEGFYDYMSRKYDYVFRISSVSSPYPLIPHFEILGR